MRKGLIKEFPLFWRNNKPLSLAGLRLLISIISNVGRRPNWTTLRQPPGDSAAAAASFHRRFNEDPGIRLGALTPFIRWLQHATAPPQPRAHVQPHPSVHLDDQQNRQPEENAGAENENQNQLIENGEQSANENQPRTSSTWI